MASQQGGAIARAERGEVTLSEVSEKQTWLMLGGNTPGVTLLVLCVQMMPLLEAECVKEAQARGVTLPPEWSALAVVEKLREAMKDVQPAALKAAAKLRDDGICRPYPPPGGSKLLWLLACKLQKKTNYSNLK